MKKTVVSILLMLLLFAAGYIVRVRTEQQEALTQAAGAPAESLQPVSVVSLYDVPAINGRERSGTALRSPEPKAQALSYAPERESALCREDLWLDDIALTELYTANGNAKPLLLFLHGLGQNRESSLLAAEAYARAGYFVVCMDAFNQGARSPLSGYCDFWAAILITVADIDHVLEHYERERGLVDGGFVLAGFSMGAVEAWSYAISGQREPAAILSLCGIGETACWQDWVRELLPAMWLKSWDGLAWAFPELQSEEYTAYKSRTMAGLDASANADAFAELPVFCAIGSEDAYFSAGRAEETMTALTGTNLCFRRYEGEAHGVSPAMIADSLDFLQAVAA